MRPGLNVGAAMGQQGGSPQSAYQNAGGGVLGAMVANQQGGGAGGYSPGGRPQMNTGNYGGGGSDTAQYPGSTNWWQRPAQAPQSQWQAPASQFNYGGGYAPSGYSAQGPYSGGQGYGAQGMPSYQAQQYGNTAMPQLQQAMYQRQLANYMPQAYGQQYNFENAANGLGIMGQVNSGQMFPGYGSAWGPTQPGQYHIGSGANWGALGGGQQAQQQYPQAFTPRPTGFGSTSPYPMFRR